MKKNGLFKIIVILILAIVLLSWFIPAGYYSSGYVDNGITRLGIFDFYQYLILPFFQSMFLQVLLFVLAVGALYGVLIRVGAYRTLMEKIAKKFEKKGNLFLLITAFIFAALSSFGGYGVLLFLFIPAVISIILLQKYDKFTAFLATFGAILVGAIGYTFATNFLSAQLAILSLNITSQILFKVGMFVCSFVILAIFMIKHANKAKKINSKKSDLSKEIDEYLGVDTNSRKKRWPLLIIFGLLFVLLILGCTNWISAFNIEIFENLHSAITEFTIKDYAIFSYLLGSISALGNWSFFEMTAIVIIAALVVGAIYKIKFSDIIESMAEGAKSTAKAGMLLTFAYGLLIITVNSGVYITLISYIIDGAEKFNAFFASIITLVGSVFYVDLLYLGNYMLPYLAGVYSSSNALASLNIISQGINGVAMLVAPTSVVLILGLTYLNIPYKKWLKFIWKFALYLLLVVIITIALVAII